MPRPVAWIALSVIGLFIAAAVTAVLVSRRAEEGPMPPPDDVGLLSWAPRGDLRGDTRVIDEAVAVWRAGKLVDGRSADVPADAAYVVWAGRIGLGRVVLVQAVSADGTPLVAQVSEHGDPPAFALDVVEEIPASEPVALAVTYDGNLDIPGLGAGDGASLVQLLQAPPADEQVQTLWRQPPLGADDELELFEFPPDGMGETFLHLGSGQDPGASVVIAGTIGGRAGIAGTVEVLPRHLIPRAPAVQLADGAPWGPSGRIDGGEYRDALFAAAAIVGTNDATVREVASGAGEVDGARFSARLLEVVRDADSAFLVLVARDAEGEVACLRDSSVAAATVGADLWHGEPLVAERCAEERYNLLVTAAAAIEGRGPVHLRGSAVTAAEETERLVVIEPYTTAPRTPVVASLVDDPSVTVTLRPLAPLLQ